MKDLDALGKKSRYQLTNWLEMPSEETVLQLRQRIKNWEYEFHKTHQRVPTKLDIKANGEIYKLYKTYRYIRESKSGLQKSEDKTRKGINIELDDAAEDSSDVEIENITELGPTPQTNGKVLSIFDLRMTPPHSSPLKRKLVNNLDEDDVFKTPTKTKSIVNNLENPPRLSISQQLLSIANKTPTKTPRQAVVETPSYLGRINNRNSGVSLENSPPMFKIPPSPSKLKTPTKPPPPINFLVSPSPLKLHRFINKKLSQVFNDFKQIQQNQQNLQIDQEFDKLIQEVGANDGLLADEHDERVSSRRKQKTQKRSTRRWKIKPKESVNDGEDTLNNKNLHNEIKKIETETVDALNNLGKSDDENYVSSDSDEEYQHQDQSNTKGMVKPISNNYKRLKINDPRSKRFKNRYKR